MAKRKQDPTLELGPSSNEDENQEQGLVLRVPTAEAIFPAEKETEIRADIAKLVTKYTGFKIESKAQLEEVSKELRTLVKKRTMVDGKDGWRLSTNRIVNAIGAKILSILEPAETLLASIKKSYDDAEAERIRIEKEARDKLIKDRTAEMFALGGTYNGSAYVLGDVEIFPEDLPGDGYILKIEKMRLEKVRLENEEKERLAELERQRLAKEAADKLRIENERQQAEIEAMKAQLAALQAEKEKPVVPNFVKSDALAPNQVAGIDDNGKPFVMEMPTPKAEEVLAALNEPTGEPVVVTTSPLMRSAPIIDTTDRDDKKHGPTVVTTPSGKVIDVPCEMLVDDVPIVATTPEHAPPSIIPTDPSEREIWLAGAKAAFGMAKREFPDITPAQWRDCWRRFQEM